MTLDNVATPPCSKTFHKLRSVAEARLLVFKRPLDWLFRDISIALLLPGVSERLQLAANKRLNFWLGVCGCQIAALVFIGTLLWSAFHLIAADIWTLGMFIRLAGFVLLLTILAKCLTVLAARIAFALQLLHFARPRNQSGSNSLRSDP